MPLDPALEGQLKATAGIITAVAGALGGIAASLALPAVLLPLSSDPSGN